MVRKKFCKQIWNPWTIRNTKMIGTTFNMKIGVFWAQSIMPSVIFLFVWPHDLSNSLCCCTYFLLLPLLIWAGNTVQMYILKDSGGL